MRKAHDEDWFFFDAQERALVDDALEAIGASNSKQRQFLEGMLARLRRLAELIRDSPSLSASWEIVNGAKAFSADSLIEQLVRVPDYDLDLHIPTKAVVGQAYLVAKINFLKALGYTLRTTSAPSALGARIDREVGQSIYSKLAEELFVSIVTDPGAAPLVKTNAARFLYRIWEERLLIEVDDFAPILESVWEARSKLLPVLGTMLGTHEVFRLFQEARDKRFLDYFGEDDVETDPLLAFEEFLFDLSHEEIARLRAHMVEERRACITLEGARELLGGAAATWAPHEHGAQALYTSYKKRRVNAAHRALTNASGPKKTAEEYVMSTFLSQADA